jgi:hypothetical protein
MTSAITVALPARPRKVLYVTAYAAVASAASIAMHISAAGETVALSRILLGLLGIAGAALLWTRPRIGWSVLLAWAAVQIPFIAWSTDGSPLVQLFSLPLSVKSESHTNGVLTSYSEFGINLVGLVATILIARWRRE